MRWVIERNAALVVLIGLTVFVAVGCSETGASVQHEEATVTSVALLVEGMT